MHCQRKVGIFMNSGLQAYNEQNKLAQWAQKVAQCRDSGLSVQQWCQEQGINVPSYYKWQRKVYAAAKAQQESRFVEVTPEPPVAVSSIAVTVRIASAETDIHSGADAATIEAVLRVYRPALWD